MNEYDFNATEFLPKDTRLKGDLLETSGWDGHPVTIVRLGQKTYDATEDRPAEKKLQVFFRELGDYALECNSRQLKKLMELFGEQTGGWIGRQIILVSADGGVFKGQPCKTITIKEVRSSVMPVVGGIAPPPNVATAPAPATEMPPMGLGDGGDPFDDDDITPDQLAEINALCEQVRRNAVLTSQTLYSKNPDQLTMSQATDFLVKLKGEAAKTVAAMTR
jgi:hypothetical protein